MEIKTCEQYVLAKLEEAENEIINLNSKLDYQEEKIYEILSERDYYKNKYEELKNIIIYRAENNDSYISFFIHKYNDEEEFEYVEELLKEKTIKEIKEKLDEIEEE